MVQTTNEVVEAYIDTLDKLMADISTLERRPSTFYNCVRLETLRDIHKYMCMKIIGEESNENR